MRERQPTTSQPARGCEGKGCGCRTRPKPSASIEADRRFGLATAIGNRRLGRLLQAKLIVGPSNDRYEREADRVADQVMRMARPYRSVSSGVGPGVRRTCAACEAGGTPCSTCAGLETLQPKPLAERITPIAQRQGLPGGGIAQSGAVADSVVRPQQGGQPLSTDLRAFFEPRFGVDFSTVRVHRDPRAAAAARSINARAYTIGRDIVFGEGAFRPNVTEGRRLLAHELTHFVQQSGGGRGSTALGTKRLNRSSKRAATIQRQDDDTADRRASEGVSGGLPDLDPTGTKIGLNFFWYLPDSPVGPPGALGFERNDEIENITFGGSFTGGESQSDLLSFLGQQSPGYTITGGEFKWTEEEERWWLHGGQIVPLPHAGEEDSTAANERTFWSRGGTTLASGLLLFAAGAFTIATMGAGTPVLIGVAGGMALAGGLAVTSMGAVQLGTSYAGLTTAEEDERRTKAANLVGSLSSPFGLAGGVTGSIVAENPREGLETGAFIGNLAELGTGITRFGLARFSPGKVHMLDPSDPVVREAAQNIADSARNTRGASVWITHGVDETPGNIWLGGSSVPVTELAPTIRQSRHGTAYLLICRAGHCFPDVETLADQTGRVLLASPDKIWSGTTSLNNVLTSGAINLAADMGTAAPRGYMSPYIVLPPNIAAPLATAVSGGQAVSR